MAARLQFSWNWLPGSWRPRTVHAGVIIDFFPTRRRALFGPFWSQLLFFLQQLLLRREGGRQCCSPRKRFFFSKRNPNRIFFHHGNSREIHGWACPGWGIGRARSQNPHARRRNFVFLNSKPSSDFVGLGRILLRFGFLVFRGVAFFVVEIKLELRQTSSSIAWRDPDNRGWNGLIRFLLGHASCESIDFCELHQVPTLLLLLTQTPGWHSLKQEPALGPRKTH